jgi:hypothetical protein
MKNTICKIGEQWLDLNPNNFLWEREFINSHYYTSCIEKGKSNIERFVNNNKTMLSLVSESGYRNDYALRQIIYNNSYLSAMTARLQTAGRRYYRNQAIDHIKTVIASEYENLPKFFRDAYSIDDIALSYFNKATADWGKEINKLSTAYFYQTMRRYIETLI